MKYSSPKIIDILNKVKQLSNDNFSQEICGFIGFSENKYQLELGKNIASDPRNFFCIDPIQFLSFKHDNELLFCFHSHILGDEQFSEFDVKMSEGCCIPFLVYSLNTKKFNIYCPKNNDSDVNKIERFKERI